MTEGKTPPSSPESRMFSPASARNQQPIWEALRAFLPAREAAYSILEVGSGTGQHAAFFTAQDEKIIWQPSDRDDQAFGSIRAWGEEGGAGWREPRVLSATAPQTWPEGSYDMIYCANVIHISPWEVCLGLFTLADQVLSADGRLFLYGPFLQDDVPTAPSNLQFDQSLRARDPSWGIRNLKDVEWQAQKLAGLRREQVIQMPANNLSVLFRRQP